MTVRGSTVKATMVRTRPAYRAERDVSPTSTTETFVALKLRIDNWRWADVPFYFTDGKRLARRTTEIAIQFKRAPFQLFEIHRSNACIRTAGLHIQPEKACRCGSAPRFPVR